MKNLLRNQMVSKPFGDRCGCDGLDDNSTLVIGLGRVFGGQVDAQESSG